MEMQMNEERLTMTVKEVAVALGVSESTVREGVRTKTIPSLPLLGRRVLIPRAGLMRMLETATAGVP